MSRHGQPVDTRPAALALTALLGLALLLPMAAAAAEPVGHVIARSGGVHATDADDERRRLDRRDPVFAGDMIRTGPRGRAQIRFIDEGMVDLEPRTRFGVDEYRQEQDGGNVVMNFLAGALRAVTGAIGTREDDEYTMNTPVATIGVRGTAYALRLCDADCAEETGDRAGLYGRVEDDYIVVDTPAGSATFGEGDYFYVPEGGPPEGIVAPRAGILDGGDDAPGGDTTDLPDVGIRPAAEDRDDPFAGQPGDDIIEPTFEENETFPIGEGGEGMVGGFVDQVALEGNFGATTHADSQNFQETGGVVESFDFGGSTIAAGDGTLVDLQSFDGLNVVTGRWTGAIEVRGSSTTGDMHFAWTDNLISSEQLSALSGSISYSLAGTGGPDIFDTDGGQWFTDTLAMTVDFSAGAVGLDDLTVSPEAGIDASAITFTQAPSASFLSQSGEIEMLQIDSNRGGDSLSLFGQIVGGNGEGVIVSFQVDDNVSFREMAGVRVLQP